jgi:hypothetical protein
MQRSDREHALCRLRNAPYPSDTTGAAIKWILEEDPTEAALIEGLFTPHTAPMALETFSALQSESEDIFEAVQGAIGSDLCKSWALFESLHRLPWYGGIRAFLSLPDPPQSSPCAYAFFILARNKIFIPPYISGDPYNRCFHAMWRLASMARDGNWRDADEGIITVIEMLETHLDRPEPDEFIVYFTALVLGRMAPAQTMLRNLRRHASRSPHPAIQRVAHLTLRHLQTTLGLVRKWQAESRTHDDDHESPTRPSRRFPVPATIAVLVASVVLGTVRYVSLARQKLCEWT